jgi:hypothetical protein
MLNELSEEPVHLHVVGPHQPTPAAADLNVSFHGRLGRSAIRALHADCDVFVSPVRAVDPLDPSGDGGVTDGFPPRQPPRP